MKRRDRITNHLVMRGDESLPLWERGKAPNTSEGFRDESTCDLCLALIFGGEIGNSIEFSLVSCDHDQIIGASGGGNEDVVGADRLALSFALMFFR
ncbi:hypothetical protein IQ266_10570 [filamentous cyanobacterium LEGE 11480]|uniref:Uncharacterized protein n=1 Tax=Romeriopsis navalis LEGE 11480 TaxID=2777977 RepID=A0A928VPI6_9CYAN|nr:hypothetical protein [Romeriopsis navalis]MBE9030172.1 hypothetical protein [Romeriopsis navalis LEGE 11480]